MVNLFLSKTEKEYLKGKKKHKNRKDLLLVSHNCHLCHKQISTLFYGFLGHCKCENVYCFQHKYPEDHKCTHDYKSEQKEKLEKLLPVIVVDKVPNRI